MRFSVILRLEYHATLFALRRAILLCSDRMLRIVVLSCGQLLANRISLYRQKREDSSIATDLLFSVVGGFGLLPKLLCAHKCDADS